MNSYIQNLYINTCELSTTFSKVIVILFVMAVFTKCSLQDITEDNLDNIRSSKKIWLVYQTSNTAGPNIQILNEVEQILAGFFKIGVLPSTGQDKLTLYGDEEIIYTGSHDVDSIVKFVLSYVDDAIKARGKIANDVKANKQFLEKQAQRAKKQWEEEQQLRKKSNTVVLDAKNWQTTFLRQRQPYFINFYEANCSACIQLNREWEAVSTALKGKARVGKLNITQSESLEQQLQLTQFPAIRYYSVGNKKVESFVQFDGVKKKFSILEWANSQLTTREESVDITQLDKSNYRSMCKDSKSTCIIVFVEDPSTVSKQVGQLAAKYLKKPISFLVSKKGSQPEFEKQVGVQSAPDTVMMYCKGNKMLRMGGMDFKVIDEVINQITLGNRNNFVKYKFEQNLK